MKLPLAPVLKPPPPDRLLPGNVHAPSYTEDNFDPQVFQQVVDAMVKKVWEIKSKHPSIEALAGCGISGLLMMGAISYATGLPQIAVRKPHETTHDPRRCNGWLGSARVT